MSDPDAPRTRRPWWVTALCVLVCLPLPVLPAGLIPLGPDDPLQPLLRLLPYYVVASGACAWFTWPQRPLLGAILLALAALSQIAVAIV